MERNQHCGHVLLGSRAPLQAPPRLLQEGRNAFQEKDWAKAERLFADAIRSEPGAAWPYRWLGMTNTPQEKFELAEQPFRRASEIDPKEPNACYYWVSAVNTSSTYRINNLGASFNSVVTPVYLCAVTTRTSPPKMYKSPIQRPDRVLTTDKARRMRFSAARYSFWMRSF